MNDFQKIMAYRKNGELDKAEELASACVLHAPDDLWFKRAMAWVLYDRLKAALDQGKRGQLLKLLDRIGRLELGPDEEYLQVGVARMVNRIFRNEEKNRKWSDGLLDDLMVSCRRMQWKKPSEAWSILLEGILAFKGTWEGRLDTLRWWGLEDHLRPEDYLERKASNGRNYMSLAETAYGRLTKAWLERIGHHGTAWPPDLLAGQEVEELIAILGRLAADHPRYKFPVYYQARLLWATRSAAEALAVYKPFMQRNTRSFWAWELWGDLMEDQPEQAASCYAKALACGDPPAFLSGALWKLARIMANMGRYGEAAESLERLVTIREKEGWPLRPDMEAMIGLPWYIDRKHDHEKDWMDVLARCADDLILPDPEWAVISYVNRQKAIVHIVRKGDLTGHFHWRQGVPLPEKGDLFKVYVKESGEGREKILSYEACDIREVEDLLKKVQGQVTRFSQSPFAWINEIHIPSDVVSTLGLEHGDDIHGWAMRSYDRKKEQWGWVFVRPIS